jgi:hypothetical protein
MKKISLFTVVLFISISIYAQKKPIDKLTYEQSQNIEYFKTVKNNTPVIEYISEDGNSFKIGDTLVLGRPTSQSSISNTYGGARSGAFSTAVARTNTRTKKEFEFIQLGRPAGFGNIMSAMAGEGATMAGVNLAGETVKIAEMKVIHKGSKKKPLKLIMVIGEINGKAFGINKFLSLLDTELAYSYGEILIKNRKMTRDEAIAKLKESKELLDLELLTQEEYNALKEELTPIIRGVN